MRNILITLLAITICSCHKQKTPAPSYTIVSKWVNVADAQQTLLITPDSITYSTPGIPIFTLQYKQLSLDTVLLPVNGAKLVLVPSKDSLTYISGSDTSMYYRQ